MIWYLGPLMAVWHMHVSSVYTEQLRHTVMLCCKNSIRLCHRLLAVWALAVA